MSESGPTTRAAAATVEGSAMDRRQVTVMFCDLVGSTELSGILDPEDLMDVVSAYQEVCSSVVGRYEGHIAKYLGDGVLVLFGYPRAHEDDAQRAVRTGLGILEAMEATNVRLAQEMGVRVAVRVGIHTGLVVAGEMGTDGARTLDIVGETPNIAARIQSVAHPDTVLISDVARRLIAGYFAYADAGLHELKGLSHPMALYRVLHESTARSRLDVGATAGLTPLVGREAERAELGSAWRAAKGGEGRVVMLRGEAGIGKSRLVRDLAESVAAESDAWLTPCQCSPYRNNVTLYPIVDALERVVLTFGGDDLPQVKLQKLEGWVVENGLAQAEVVPLLAALLSLPPPPAYPALALTPQRQKQRVIEVLVQTLVHRSKLQPLLFLVEDLHWSDASTGEFLSALIERAPQCPMLVVLTSRLDFDAPWAGPHVSVTTLGRLNSALVIRLTEGVARGKVLPVEIQDQIISKADGNPLYVEELTKDLLESNQMRETEAGYEMVGTLAAVSIPVSLEASLLARLDRLSVTRALVQVGAVLGRDFSFEMIRAVMQAGAILDEPALAEGLRQLVRAEILYQRSADGPIAYVFKHALIRDAAYESILRRQRRSYHALVASVLDRDFPDTALTQPELLAHHYAEAANLERALHFWQAAAQLALSRSGNVEAIAHLSAAMELIAQMPEGLERALQELNACVAMGMALTAVRGYSSGEVEATFTRARELSLRVGDTPQLGYVIYGLCLFYITGGRLPIALAATDQLEALAEAHPEDLALALLTCKAKGIALFCSGDFEGALPWLERGWALYDPGRHASLVGAHGGAEAGITLRVTLAVTLWALGDLGRATALMEEYLSAVRLLDHPFSHAFAHHQSAWLHKLCGSRLSLQEANLALELCDRHGYVFWGYLSVALRGSCLVDEGLVDEGITQMRIGLSAFEAIGGQLYRSALQGLLADALRLAGRVEEGLELLAEALAGLEVRQERWFEAELHRLRGELLAAQPGRLNEAVEALSRAISIAKGQKARSWEQRARETLDRIALG